MDLLWIVFCLLHDLLGHFGVWIGFRTGLLDVDVKLDVELQWMM